MIRPMSTSTTRLSRPLIRAFAAAKPIRTGSLIVSIFGDSVAPRGGVVWLGSLIKILEPLGISHRLVRTAAYRLVQDGILSSEQEGRRSFYMLTPDGRRQFEEASERIYAGRRAEWDGRWCLVFTKLLPPERRSEVKTHLRWLGFGQFSGDVVAHPNPDTTSLLRHLQRFDARDDCVVFDAELPSAQSQAGVSRLVRGAWDLGSLEQAYANYLAKFRPIQGALCRYGEPEPADAFYIRTFTVHDYRKILLRDPGLPDELLPNAWKGHLAYQLNRDLYRRVTDASERHIDEQFRNQIGNLPPPTRAFHRRFGGL